MCAKMADGNTEKLSREAKLSHCDERKSAAYAKCMRYLLFKEISHYYQAQTRLAGGEAVK